VQPYAFALTYLALGDNNRALEWLEEGVRDRGATYLQFSKGAWLQQSFTLSTVTYRAIGL